MSGGPTKGMVAGKAITTNAQTKEFDEGYDRIFGERKPTPRGKFRWNPETKSMEQVGADWTDAEKRAPNSTEELVYGGLRATDGTPIDSRTKHREYMKANGLAMDSDFKEHRVKAAQRREEVLSGRADSKERREIIGRALHEARGKRK